MANIHRRVKVTRLEPGMRVEIERNGQCIITELGRELRGIGCTSQHFRLADGRSMCFNEPVHTIVVT
jgi:hypothetical protein